MYPTSPPHGWSQEAGGGGWLLPLINYIGWCAAVKGMIFEQFSLEKDTENRYFWSRIGYHFPGNWSTGWTFYLGKPGIDTKKKQCNGKFNLLTLQFNSKESVDLSSFWKIITTLGKETVLGVKFSV